jgi:hypothetical protein
MRDHEEQQNGRGRTGNSEGSGRGGECSHTIHSTEETIGVSQCHEREEYLLDTCCSALPSPFNTPSPHSHSIRLSSNKSQRFDLRDGHVCET